MLQATVEVHGAKGLELAGELHGKGCLHESQDASRVADYVGIGLASGVVHPTFFVDELHLLALVAPGLHVAIAIPGRPTLLEPYSVDHAIPAKPMARVVAERIGTIAQIEAVQLGRNIAPNLEIRGADLVFDWRKVAPEVEGEVGHRCIPSCCVRDRDDSAKAPDFRRANPPRHVA